MRHPIRKRAIPAVAFQLLTCTVLTAAAVAFVAPSALAADVLPGWGSWWLPPNHSAHGGDIDRLFAWIFWITMITFVLVEGTLVVFLIKYRHRPERRKAHFTHGNTRLEMAWTLLPAVILAVLALASKKVWDNFRYAPASEDPTRAQILVIGQQFKWNSVYPGPDGKFGKYLMFPKPSDPYWPPNKDGKPFLYQVGNKQTQGPADLPYDQAAQAINQYIDTVNPLGKDYTDPDGKDDDFEKALAREIILPANRPIEVQLSSKDVIHDFFLPNFRVKLDAVPGMRGHIYFTSLMTSKQREALSRQQYTIDAAAEALKKPDNKDLTISISEADKDAGAEQDARSKQWMFREKEGKKATIVRDGRTLTPDIVAKLKANGVPRITAYLPGYWDLVCEELCGQGHYTMQGKVIFVDNDEYKTRFETPAGAAKTAMVEPAK